ncbi:hypothetical protein KCM76_19300 [Zooshikella marina]|uniref:hypothetical protein n=1 Tax=Zooshikella ganghwensis TaxID=202772 RepID=UPI001BAF7F99|nr:hypothetical protein [Zooshikella ganghwensis]MBU2708147.1 hypothetical protein [Zooshikella ganghwensis]
MQMSTTRLSALKRPLKKVRNFFKDPLPRDKELIFEDYELKFPDIIFTYRVGNQRYNSWVRFDLPIHQLSNLNRENHHPLFVNLGLAFAAGHFILSDFATIRCDCAKLNDQECALLEQRMMAALAEFRYLQGLDPSRPVAVLSSGKRALHPIPFAHAEEKALMLNGGGKDSCVSAELLKGIGLPFAWLSAHPNPIRLRVIDRSGNPEKYAFDFSLSEQAKTDAVYPWGAEPYLQVITAASLIISYLTGFKYLVTGAEHSADDSNLIYKGVEVNHQSGKTSTFENFFNTFIQNSVLQEAKLFSIARPFTDFRLGEMFSHFPQYFDAFFSCNMGMGKNKWCNNCHKCAFTYMALYPFFEQQTLINIFGQDLFKIPTIRKYMIELTTATIKPWECVGTLDECKLALRYCLKKSPNMEFNEWPRRSDLEKSCHDIQEQTVHEHVMSTFHTPHNIPGPIEQPLRDLASSLRKKSIQRWPEIIQS